MNRIHESRPKFQPLTSPDDIMGSLWKSDVSNVMNIEVKSVSGDSTGDAVACFSRQIAKLAYVLEVIKGAIDRWQGERCQWDEFGNTVAWMSEIGQKGVTYQQQSFDLCIDHWGHNKRWRAENQRASSRSIKGYSKRFHMTWSRIKL
jgi:hypothetical protein